MCPPLHSQSNITCPKIPVSAKQSRRLAPTLPPGHGPLRLLDPCPLTRDPGYNTFVTTTLLFDVDQTLLYSGGAGSLAMRRAFHELYGFDDGFRNVESTGRTDWAILKDAFRNHGLLEPPEPREGQINQGAFPGVMAAFQQTYYRLLEPALREAEGGHLKPGIVELLEALAGLDNVRLGLATGNFRGAAMTKLRFFGLQDYFSDGGFGDDAEDRGDLVGVAIGRIAGPAADPRSVWVIGDTRLDVHAARANGVLALGVATGTTTVEELEAAGATVVLRDLSNTEEVLEALLG